MGSEHHNRRRDGVLIGGLLAVSVACAGTVGVHFASATPVAPPVALEVGSRTAHSTVMVAALRSVGTDVGGMAGTLPLASHTLVVAPGAGEDAPIVAEAGRLGVDSVALTSAEELPTVGLGATLADAERPLVLATPHGTVGVVAFSDVAPARAAGVLGVAPSPDSIRRGIDLARGAGADVVVACVNWSRTIAEQAGLEQQFADAGYHAVVGIGEGTAPLRRVGATVVVPRTGWLDGAGPAALAVRLRVARERIVRVEVGCVAPGRVADVVRPHPCEPAAAASVFATAGARAWPRSAWARWER